MFVVRHLLEERERDWGFWLKKEERKEAMADEETIVPMELFIERGEEDESVAVRRYGFYL